jgi:tetratricopeptide (TPR) repeat protein
LIAELSNGVSNELKKIEATDERVSAITVKVLATQLGRVEEENAALRGQLEALREQLQAAVARTVKAAEAPGASAAAVAAVGALEAGDTKPAEALVKVEEGAQAAQIGVVGEDERARRREAAALAREQGAMAMGRDVRAALAAYERAAEYEPEDHRAHIFIGDLWVLLGDLSAAMRSFGRAHELILAAAERDPANTGYQRELLVSHNRFGDVLVVQGDGPGALLAYRKGMEIAEALVALDPANTGWQRDLSVSQEGIGDVLVAEGDGAGAIWAYRNGLEIVDAVARRDPVGNVLAARGGGGGALAAHRKGLEIAEALAGSDPANALWQTDLAFSCSILGRAELGQSLEARREYLLRGRGILAALKEAGRLLPAQDWIGWFDEALGKLG